ncbi:hypothetical protein [Paraclostridium dentum]|uniref:hypothetical protein n=1 Tax=Paraclostridium dentum TaxID=2662455 RepID=UPI003F2EA636
MIFDVRKYRNSKVLMFASLFILLTASCKFFRARLNIFTGAEGGDGAVQCHSSAGRSSSGSWKFFCKEECTEEGILVKAESDTANNGRYSIKYESGSSGRTVLSVTIRNLTQSDSGRYKYGVGTSSGPDSYCEIEARVSDGEFLLEVYLFRI